MKFDPEVNPILEHIQNNPVTAETREYAFSHAIDFYNGRKYFEAHEVFEFQWRKEEGDLKIFIQALIQICVTMHKIFVNVNKRGALSQATLALDKLGKLYLKDNLREEGLEHLTSLIESLKIIIAILKNERKDSYYLPPVLLAESFEYLA